MTNTEFLLNTMGTMSIVFVISCIVLGYIINKATKNKSFDENGIMH